MKLLKFLSYFATAGVVALVSVLVVGGAIEQPANALAACTPDRTSTYAGSTYVEFTTVTAGCTWTIPSGVTSLAEVLIVAGGGGGGGGGRWGGGGGGGEVIGLSSVSVSSTVDIGVGVGGAAGGSTCAVATNGGNSFLVGGSYSATAFGGGGGGPDNQDTCSAPTGTYIKGASGGSGGGSGQSNKKAISNIFASSLAATSTPPGYGNNSGSYTYTVDAGGNRSGTGGGGAGAAGGSLVVGGGNGLGGKGGDGTNLFHTVINEANIAAGASSIGQYVASAAKYYVAGGGAGASSNYSVAAAGGLGGGGSGSSTNPTNILVNCSSGIARTGGGGGNRCAGGSGFVLIKYTTPVTITYSISYDANSATSGSVPSAGSYRSGDVAYTVASNSGTLDRTGYSFAGWNTLADGSGTTYVASSGTLTTSSNLTLYAKWTLLTYSITYNSNSSTSGSVPGTQTKTYGVDLTVASNSGTLARTGYNFVGWNTLADGSGTTFVAGSGTLTANSSATLFANWTANTYTISYDANSATSGSVPSAGSYRSGDVAYTVVSNSGTLERTGYSFAGWNTLANGSGTTYAAGSGTLTTSLDITLYGKWTANSLTVTYDSQLGSAITAGSTTTGGSISASPGTPSRTGYEFTGWFTASTGGTQISFPYAHGQTSSFTLYAQWSANALTVTYDSQLGTAITAGSTFTGGSILASPGTPSRTGYEFAGWSTASIGGTQISFPFAHGQTASFTLFAQWTANTLTVTYDSQLGTAITAGATTTGSSIASPGAPSRTGYEFTGWFTASSSGTVISFPYMHGQTSSFTLFAQWTANSLTVTYDSQSGSAIAAGATITGGSISASPGTPSRTGYTFIGWFASATGGTAISFPYVHGQTTNFIRYAQWTQTSLYGLGSKTRIGTITTANGVGNTFVAETAVSSVSLRYPADGLPAGTVIDVYLVNDLSRAGKLIERDGGFVISLVVAWLAADGSVPLTATDKPISMTIANTTIKAGAKTYAILGGVVTLIGTATTDGTVTVLIYEDPEIVVVNPMAVAAPAAKPIDVAPIVATPTPAAVNPPAVTSPVVIPTVLARSWSITFLPYVASIYRNNQVAWTAFATSQGSSTLSCSITGISPSEKSKVNNKLFENRQTSLITMLKYNGCEKVAIRTPSRSTQSAITNRTWKVDVEPSASAIDFNWTHDFETYSSVIDRKQVPQWSAFIANNGSAVLSCSITGVEPLTKSKANTKLFDKRNESMKAYLLKNGCASVQMGKPIGRKEKLALRTIWKVAAEIVN
jgi:uncharacterized repeat protein (TIGR02543 family)